MLNIDKSIPCNPGNYAKGRNRKVDYIVIHYTGGTATAKQNAQYYASAGGRGASAHFFVGHKSEGAKIYQSIDPNDTAWHCGTTGTYCHPSCRNSNSIGIETCCHNDTPDKSAASLCWYFDSETVDALVELTRDLMAKYGITADHVVRHYDVTHKICPAMWVHDEAAWKAFELRLVALPTKSKSDIRPTLKMSSKGDDVKTLQTRLNALKFPCGPSDGDFGSRTLEAVKAFQAARGLVADGVVGPSTWRALMA